MLRPREADGRQSPRERLCSAPLSDDYEDLAVGHLFRFKGPRRFLVFQQELAGVVIGMDHDVGVLHLMILDDPDESPAIMHLPLLGSALAASKATVFDQQEVPTERLEPILAEWRDRHGAGEVGAFGAPLAETIDLVERTLADGGKFLDQVRLRHAYPKREPITGEFRVVEAVAIATEPASGQS